MKNIEILNIKKSINVFRKYSDSREIKVSCNISENYRLSFLYFLQNFIQKISFVPFLTRWRKTVYNVIYLNPYVAYVESRYNGNITMNAGIAHPQSFLSLWSCRAHGLCDVKRYALLRCFRNAVSVEAFRKE